MKSAQIYLTLLFAVVASAAFAKDPAEEVLSVPYGEVVFVRAESNGSLNILPSTITCDGLVRLVMTGGEASAICLPGGDYRFQVFSPKPYEPPTDPTACRSTALAVRVRNGTRVYVEVTPELDDQSIHLRWELNCVSGRPPRHP